MKLNSINCNLSLHLYVSMCILGGFLTAGLLSYLRTEQYPEQNGNLVRVPSSEEMAQCMVDAYSYSLKKHEATEAKLYLCSPQPRSKHGVL